MVRAIACLLTITPFLGCASVERGRYGVDEVQLRGMEQMSQDVLRTCLLTRERDSFGLRLGLGAPRCDRPPFDREAIGLTLWRWPWTEWPILNKAVVDKDVERILRWYRARGFYGARVVDIQLEPPEAGQARGDRLEENDPARCDPDRDECTAAVTITIEEGQPVRVGRVLLAGTRALPDHVRRALRGVPELRPGERFDEHTYDEDKERLAAVLEDAAYADARVTGETRIDTTTRTAVVRYDIDAGPAFTLGRLSVTGQGDLSEAPIIAAAALEPDTPYSPAVIADIQREIQALGDFAAVHVEEHLDRERAICDLTIEITLGEPHALRLGIGIQSGSMQRADDVSIQSVPQWDIHLLTRYSYNHVFDTLGKFQIEERPRIIYNAVFPQVEEQSFGNILRTSISQPGLLEARTDTSFSVTWDYGPDPYLGFERSDIVLRLAAERWFLARVLDITLSLQQDFYIVPQDQNPPARLPDAAIVAGRPVVPSGAAIGGVDTTTVLADGNEIPTTYNVSFFGQKVVVDLRDTPARPRKGAYFGLSMAEAAQWQLSDWTLVFLRPEVRGYLPLPLDIVLAGRFAMAWNLILSADTAHLEPTSERLGPSAYRLRGGGAYSVRGFAPGRLGDSQQGGLRRWEAMFEARVPIGESFELAGLLDFGDVSEGEFRFAHLNTSAGIGLRFHSPIGAIRLDTSFRVMSLQVLGGPRPEVSGTDRMFVTNAPGAMHFTIGEAF